jgi:hypothetical protein
VQVNPERNPFGHGHQHNAPGPAFPHPFVHRIRTPNQAGAENSRQLASRYVHHPDAQVRMVYVEVAAPGRFNIVIMLDSRVTLGTRFWSSTGIWSVPCLILALFRAPLVLPFCVSPCYRSYHSIYLHLEKDRV